METAIPTRSKRLQQRETAQFGAGNTPGGDLYQNKSDFIAWAQSFAEVGLVIKPRQKTAKGSKNAMLRLSVNFILTPPSH